VLERVGEGEELVHSAGCPVLVPFAPITLISASRMKARVDLSEPPSPRGSKPLSPGKVPSRFLGRGRKGKAGQEGGGKGG